MTNHGNDDTVRISALWSLWDMLRFYADKFVGLYAFLGSAENIFSHPEDDQNRLATDRTFLKRLLIDGKPMMDAIGLRQSSKKALAIIADCDKDYVSRQALTYSISALSDLIKNELEDGFFLHLTDDESAIFEPKEPLFGVEVDIAFPSSIYDIAECGKCYALGRSTASIMHSMRALEPALIAMAIDLNITLKRDNWGNALTLIEKALPNVADRDKREFMSGAAIQFRHFKDAWRNHSMHARVKYTTEEADIVMRATKAFMRHLSKRVKE